MAVAHKRNIIIDVEVRPSRFIVKKLLPAANNVERLRVGDAQVATEKILSLGD